MDAADGGFLAPEHSGTTSTATPGGRSVWPVVAGHPGPARGRVHGTKAHRIRVTAWLLGVTAVLLLLAGVGALLTAVSPEAPGDREATANLLTGLQRARGNTAYRPEANPVLLAAQDASARPQELSLSQGADLWFGASRSTSGTCFVLGARVSGRGSAVGTLGRREPCNGNQARLRLEKKLGPATS
jgi:hypothetical protein